MELGQKGKGLTFKLYRDVPKCYKATAADTARFEKFLKIVKCGNCSAPQI